MPENGSAAVNRNLRQQVHRRAWGELARTRRWKIWLFATLLGVSGVGCQRHGEYFGKVEPPPENVFRFNNGAEPEYLDPGLMTGQPDGRIAQLIFEGLTTNDPETFEPRPGVAARWEVSPDGRTYTFHLRQNAYWSDGRPVTARDFIYSWTRVLDPKTASRYASHLHHLVNGEEFNRGRVKDPTQLGLRALDDYILQVQLRQPVPYFLYLTAFFTLMPVPAHIVERYGLHWTDPEYIVGNGPFLLVEHRTHARFEFVRNPRYWNVDRIRLDRIIAYSVDDNYTSANLYESGRVDWLPGSIPAEYVSYMRGHFQDFQIYPFLALYYYSFNVTRPPLDNPLVRRALSLAVDRRAITDQFLRGGQIPTSHFVPVGFPSYQSPSGPDYNPAEAARLLAQAGYPNGEGFPRLEILFNTLESHRKIAEAIQQMWARNLNIQVSLRNEEWASYLKSLANRDYDIARQGWIADYPDPSTFTDLLESTNGNNHTGWKNEAYDRLLIQAREDPDSQRRLETLRSAEAILLEELPVLPLYTYASNSLIKPYVRGLYPSPMDQHPLTAVWIDRDWNRTAQQQEGER
ncbi:MAG: peptide ABC transporter substrate-binding protein [Acidobacteria bacterium]|nr:peptide ABC transporter substrate-binding protein [Acidobacteriota bacterium]